LAAKNGSRRRFGLGERQALLPEIGHDPLAFGAEQLPFQPGELLGEQGNLRALLLDQLRLPANQILQIIRGL